MSHRAVRWSFMRYGCTPVADNARTYAYHLWACANDLYPEACVPTLEDCSCELDDPLDPFVDPVSDDAPWYDPAVPESADFLGMMILRVDGARDSTYTRDSFDAFNNGSILSRPRIVGKSFAVRALILSTSCEGNDYGIEWVRRVLEEGDCTCSSSDPCETCGEERLQLRVTCGDEGDCDNGLREWDSVGVVDGLVKIDNERLEDCCCAAQEVSFTLQSERPFSFTCEESVIDEDVKPSWFAAVDLADPGLWYRHGETGGTVAKEEVVGNDGEYFGSPTFGAPGLPVYPDDTAVAFDGVDDWMVAPHNSVLDRGTGAFAVEGLFQTSQVSDQMGIVMNRGNLGAGAGWSVFFTNIGVLRFVVGDGVSQAIVNAGASDLWNDGSPHHFSAFRDAAGDAYLVVDGTSVYGPATAGALDIDNAFDITVGDGVQPDTEFAGTIDEIMFFPREVTLEEIAFRAEAALDPPYTRCYDWQNDCLECCEQTECDRCGYDALCTCFPPERVSVELIKDDCFCEPLQRTIICACIEDIGRVFDTALKIDIFSGAKAGDPVFTDLGMRNVRVRAWNNPDMLPCPVDDETYEAFCVLDPRFDLKIDYIPSDATLSIDGRLERVTLDCDGVCRPYASVVSSSEGSIFPLIANCDPLTICVEFDALNTQYDAIAPVLASHLTVTKYRRWRN